MRMPKENIFSTPDCLSLDTILKYLNDQLSLKDRHKVEKHMLECELCNEAMEGYSLLHNKDNASGIIFELNKGIRYKTDSVFDIRKVAAGVAAILVLGAGLFYLNYNNTSNDTPIVKVDNKDKFRPEVKERPISTSPELPVAIETRPKKSIENNTSVNKPLDKDKFDKNTISPHGISSDAYIVEKESTIPSLSNDDKVLNKNVVTLSSKEEEHKKDELDEKTENSGVAPVERRISTEPDEVQSRVDISRKKAARVNNGKEKAPSASSKVAPTHIYEMADKREVNLASLELGVQKYEEKKYVEASVVFESLIKIDSTNSKAFYYNGLSHMESGKLDLAIQNFDRVKKGKEFFEDARWNKALTLIKKGDKEKAKEIFQEISVSESPYKLKSLEELRKIE
jgi:TolA-binding protein